MANNYSKSPLYNYNIKKDKINTSDENNRFRYENNVDGGLSTCLK